MKQCRLGAARFSEGEIHMVKNKYTLLTAFLSGIATGISWLAYFRALQLGPASRVAPIDKLSLPLTVIVAMLVLSEKVTWSVALGIALMTVGALVTLL